MKTLTVFTPTFNRANLLPRLYESLCRQTSNDFLWLLIDDGSTDGTKELVEKWKNKNLVEIHYVYKENGGMHTAHNTAYSMIKTELNVCIDSDDWMPDDAVENILKKWNSVVDKTKIAGIIGLDADKDGRLIGTANPSDLKFGNLADLYQKHKVKGDKKLIIRTIIVKKYPPYPEYPGEKLVPLGTLYLMIGRNYDFIYSNEIYCIVDYQPDGSSNTIFRQYRQSPKGFGYSRILKIKYDSSLVNKFKNSVHLVSSAIFAKDLGLLLKTNQKFLMLTALPFGILLNLYIRLKTKS
ncbi:MAG: glycosyltransferase family 2 protein [Moheibacter sp.]